MKTNKPEVKRFNILTYQGAIQSKGAMCVLASDYDALQAECEKLRKLLAETVEDRDEAEQSLGLDLVERIDAAMQEQQP